MTFLLYLCKVFVCSGILLGYYWLFLRNRRFHHYNRFYLQATLLLSVILPFIKIPLVYRPENGVNQVVYQTLDVLTVNYGEHDVMVGGQGLVNRLFTAESVLYLLYGAGCLVLLWMLTRSLLYIKKISRQYPCERISELKFYATQEPGTPFSFFRSIFWNNELPFNSREGQQVFRHELFHVQQKHSTDIILAEIVTAFFWYNPFFHLLKKELKAIHEFLADQYAISGSDRYAYAELLVMQTLKTRTVPLSNYFFQNHIKRRIAMITNLTSSKYGYFSRLMILPVSVLLFCTIALYAERPMAQVSAASDTTNNQPITVVIDAGHGGSDDGAVANGFKEKDIALQISQKIQQLAPAYNVNVIMTRTGNDLPGNTIIKEDGLRARTAIAAESHADAFVSIHMAAVEEEHASDRNGVEIYITRDDKEKWIEQSKVLGSAMAQSISTFYTTSLTLLQRKQKGIWILDKSPCPAILIECGYITNDNDVAFMSNSSHQEGLAKKILEGIVNYKKQTVASAPVQQPLIKNGDSLITNLRRYFNRNVSYPKSAAENNIEGTVYYSVSIDKNGRISNFKTYPQQPAIAGKIYQQTIIAYASSSKPATTTLSNEEKTKLFQDEVKHVFEKNIDLSGPVEPGAYYFKATFRLDRTTPAT